MPGDIAEHLFSLIWPDQWAEQTFGQALLGDRRRTIRVVKAAGGLVRDPAASLSKSQQTWKALDAVYRLPDEPGVPPNEQRY